jgi:hypothetical protein
VGANVSISLLVKPAGKGLEGAVSVPLATEDVFKRYWSPVCAALGLKWVPLFQTGLPVGMDDIGEVLSELLEIRRWLDERPEQGASVIRPRLDAVITELERVASSPDVEIYIG